MRLAMTDDLWYRVFVCSNLVFAEDGSSPETWV
jgi:hypothetical protein